MLRTYLRAAFALAITASVVPALAATPPAPPPVRSAPPIYVMGGGGEYALVESGSQAPNFSFESSAGWAHLSDLRRQGHVLLLIGAGEDQLVALERERPRLMSLGVVPVAVLDRRAGGCRALASRLGLSLTIIPDSRRVIGAQFNALEPSSRADDAAWFVIDRRGRVCDLAHDEWPCEPWADICTRALGLPGADASLPASIAR